MKQPYVTGGYGHYTPDPGECESAICGLCGTLMNVEGRNVMRARGFAMAMAGRKSACDVFVCPNIDADWHKQAVELRNEQQNTVSRTISGMIEDEIVTLLAKHGCKPVEA